MLLSVANTLHCNCNMKILLPATIQKINNGMLLGKIMFAEGYREHKLSLMCSNTIVCKAKKKKRKWQSVALYMVKKLAHNQNNK